MSCGVGCRRGLDPALLWLWRRPVATAPIQPLAWEPPYAMGAALKIQKSMRSLGADNAEMSCYLKRQNAKWHARTRARAHTHLEAYIETTEQFHYFRGPG